MLVAAAEHTVVAVEEGPRTAVVVEEEGLRIAAVVEEEGHHTAAAVEEEEHQTVAAAAVAELHTAVAVEAEHHSLVAEEACQSHPSSLALVQAVVVVYGWRIDPAVVEDHDYKPKNLPTVDVVVVHHCGHRDHFHARGQRYEDWIHGRVAATTRHVEYPRGQA